jgi:surface antigen
MEERPGRKYKRHLGNKVVRRRIISDNMFQGTTLNRQANALTQSQALADIAAKKAAHLRGKSKKVSFALLSSHVAVVIGIVGIIALGYKAPVEASPSLAAQTVLEQSSTSVDQIAAATVASTVAQTLDLSVQDNVQNLAVSLNAKTELAQTDSNILSKPQIIEQNSGRKGVTAYTTPAAETVQSVAAKFGVSEDTIRWANNLTSDALPAGKGLSIPGTTGVVYTVKSGDSVAALADKYKADVDRIVTYNDLELTGLSAGAQIVIPGGILPATERPGYIAPASRYGAASVASSIRVTVFGGNGYAYGYCTWYAFNRRAELGRPIGSNWGNAVTWASYAAAGGFRVNKTPAPGAIIQNGGGYGHVGIVEAVNADGSLTVSDMNYRGWNVISTRTVPASQIGAYNYIH